MAARRSFPADKSCLPAHTDVWGQGRAIALANQSNQPTCWAFVKSYLSPLILLGIYLAISTPVAMAAPGWVTPRAPYPAAARYKHEQGIVKLKVTTGATGRVVKVVVSVPAKQEDISDITGSCGNWVFAKWSGPPNRVLETQMEFVLR